MLFGSLLKSARLSFNFWFVCLVEEANDLASNVLATGLLVVHDTSRGGEDDIAELTGRQKLDNPLLELGETDVVAGRDDTALVQATDSVSDQLSMSGWEKEVTDRPLSWTTILPLRWLSTSSNSPM